MVAGSGAWSAPLLLLAYVALATNALKWSLASYTLALFTNYPHDMATVCRAYRCPEDFNKYCSFMVYRTLLVAATEDHLRQRRTPGPGGPGRATGSTRRPGHPAPAPAI